MSNYLAGAALQATSTVSVATINSTLTLSGPITGAFGLAKTGYGLMTLSKSSNFTVPHYDYGWQFSGYQDTFLGAVPNMPTPSTIIIDGALWRATTTISAIAA